MSFNAQYTSDCENCDEQVVPGQEAVMVDWDRQLVAHAQCPAPPARAPKCPVCGLEHNGEC